MFKKLLLLLVSTAVALVLAEIGVRWWAPSHYFVTIHQDPDFETRLAKERAEPAAFTFEKAPGAGFFVRTPAGIRMRANSEVVIERHRLHGREVRIRTNEWGLRGGPIGTKQHPRALFLGDSIVVAEYLNEEDTLTARVEARARADGRPLEFLNGGVSAVGLQNELAMLTELGPHLNLDVVVLGFYLNDFQNSSGMRIWSLPKSLFGSQLARLVASRIPGVLQRNDEEAVSDTEVFAWLDAVEERYPSNTPGPEQAFNREIQRYFTDWGSSYSDAVWLRLDPLLRQLADLCEQHDWQLLWVVFPCSYQVTNESLRDEPQRKLAAIAADLGIPLFDPLVRLRALEWSEEGLFLDQCHHTARGSHQIADWLYEWLDPRIVR